VLDQEVDGSKVGKEHTGRAEDGEKRITIEYLKM
jgi:hypothetical protein